MPVLSLSYFEPSNVLLDDPEMMHVPLQMVVRTEGCLGIYQGIVNDGNTKLAFMCGAWESSKHLAAHLSRLDLEELSKSYQTVMASPYQMFSANCAHDPSIAFESPYTMVYVIKPKAQEGGSGHTALKDMAEKLVEDRSIDKRKGRLSEPTWGESVESPGTIIGIVGWESVEAAKARNPDSEKYNQLLSELLDSAEGTIQLVKFTKIRV